MDKILTAAIEKLPFPVMCFNAEGIITFANKKTESAFSIDKVKGKNIRVVIPFPETKSLS